MRKKSGGSMRVPERGVNSEIEGVRVDVAKANNRGTGGEVEGRVVLVV